MSGKILINSMRLIVPVMLVFILSGCQGGFVKSSDDPATTEELIQLKQDADLAYSNKEYEKALPMYQQLNREIPKDALLWFRTGNIHARLNQPSLAVEHYQNAVKADPTLATAWHNMGVLQLRIATNTFVQMVQNIDPDDPLYPKAVRLSESLLQVIGAKQSKQPDSDITQ